MSLTAEQVALDGGAGVRTAALLCAVALLHAPALSAQQVATEPHVRHTILIHITRGPEDPTRAALGFAVARAAIDDGDAVSIFLAGDAVQLIREPVSVVKAMPDNRLANTGIVQRTGLSFAICAAFANDVATNGETDCSS